MDDDIHVLFLVNSVIAPSIADEIAAHIDDDDLHITLGSFYASSNPVPDDLYEDQLRLEATHPADPRALSTLWEFLRDTRPDIVHVHHTVSSVWGALAGQLTPDTTVVRTEHNNHEFYSATQNAANFFSILLSDTLITNSDHTRRSFHPWENIVAPDDIRRVYNGVDFTMLDDAAESEYSIRSDIGLSDDDRLFASVGRLVDQKNFKRLVRAMVRVPDPIHLVIVGGGEHRSALETLVSREGLSERVHLTGNVERKRVYEILHDIDGYIMASLWEGFCVAVVEAMAAGNPVLCSAIPTLEEVVGDVAEFFDPKDSAEMSETIARAGRLTRAALAEWGERCRARARGRYAIESTAAGYAETYRDIARVRPG